MQELKKKYILINLLVTLVVLLLSIVTLKLIGYGWKLVQLIPVVFFYWVVYHIGFLWLCKLSIRKPKQMPLSFSIVKGIRFFLFILYAVFYCAVNKDIPLKVFLVLYAIYYIIWLTFDTWFFFKNNKTLIANLPSENENK